MLPISIVILTKNEEQNIARCLSSLKGLTDDVLVIDTGSTDHTVQIAETFGVKILHETWRGYSATKNQGNKKAVYDWILSLDADEEMNEDLYDAIQAVFSNPVEINTAFSVKRKMVYCEQELHFGSVSNEWRVRLFNKNVCEWNHNEVHEEVMFFKPVVVKKLNGFLWHYSYSSTKEHLDRLEKYAQLSAKQMAASGKNISFLKTLFSPVFGFIKNYFFKGGFIDGVKGFEFAKNEMWYVKRKYQLRKAHF